MPSTASINLELLTLIWLDQMADTTQENREIQDALRSTINYFRTFNNCQECEHYIRNTIDPKQDKLILIVSGRLGQEMSDRVHDLKQIISIFVFCFDKERNELWAKNFKKIRGVIVHLSDLLKAVDHDRRSEEQKLNESIEIFLNENQILPLLLQIKSTLVDKKDFLKICSQEYQDNKHELAYIEEFEHLYLPSNALNYFLNETFLYRLLIKSLHTFNISMLYLLRFFLQDIDEQLKTCSPVCGKVYRGQLMSTDQLEFLTEFIEKTHVRFNTILIASQNPEQIKESLQNSSNAQNLQRVLFEIDDNQIGKEYQKYVIFPITVLFRISSIRLENRIWIVKLTVSNNFSSSPAKKDKTPLELARYLRETGQLDQSEKLFELVLSQYPSLDSQCYEGLGRIAQDKSLYELSLDYYFKSLQTISRQDRAHCLNNIGCAYDYLEQYEKALQSYSEALTLMKNAENESMCLNNMGITYAKNDDYDQARKCFQRCLSRRKKCLPENHPDLGISYANLAVLSSSMGQFNDALENYQLALKCFSTMNSLDLYRAIIYQNMAYVFHQINQSDRALKFYQDAQTIFRRIRSSDHPNLLYIQQQIEQIQQEK